MIQPAAVRVAGSDDGDRAAAHGVLAAIEAKAVLLFLLPVAADAVLAQDRLDLRREVHLAGRRLWRLRVIESGDDKDEEDGRRDDQALKHEASAAREYSANRGVDDRF